MRRKRSDFRGKLVALIVGGSPTLFPDLGLERTGLYNFVKRMGMERVGQQEWAVNDTAIRWAENERQRRLIQDKLRPIRAEARRQRNLAKVREWQATHREYLSEYQRQYRARMKEAV